MAWIGAIAAPIVGGLIGSAFSSTPVSGVGTSAQPAYQPPNQAGIANQWQNYYGQLGNTSSGYYGGIQPLAWQSAQAAYNNPYASQYPAAAAQLAGTANQTAQQQLGAANQLYQTSMDPQQSLYQRTSQQVDQQARAANAAAGLGTSAAGVGLENQAMSNFNIDWQNQQLQRQLQGAQGAGNVSNQALNMMLGTYGLPYQAAQAVPTNQLGALQSYTGAVGAYPAALNQLLNQGSSYLQLGQAAQGNAFNQALANSQAQNQQAAQIGSGVTGAYQNYQTNQLMNNMIQQNPYYGYSGGGYGGSYSSGPYSDGSYYSPSSFAG